MSATPAAALPASSSCPRPFPIGCPRVHTGDWTVCEWFGRKVAVFVCFLAHSASKMVLIVPPGDWPRVVGRAHVTLPSLMTMGSASWAASVPGRLEIPSGRGSDEATRGPLGVTVVSGHSQRVPAARGGSVQRVAARSGVGSGDGGRVKRRAPAWLSPHSLRLGCLLSPRLPRPLLGPPGVGRASRVRWCAWLWLAWSLHHFPRTPASAP